MPTNANANLSKLILLTCPSTNKFYYKNVLESRELERTLNYQVLLSYCCWHMYQCQSGLLPGTEREFQYVEFLLHVDPYWSYLFLKNKIIYSAVLITGLILQRGETESIIENKIGSKSQDCLRQNQILSSHV